MSRRGRGSRRRAVNLRVHLGWGVAQRPHACRVLAGWRSLVQPFRRCTPLAGAGRPPPLAHLPSLGPHGIDWARVTAKHWQTLNTATEEQNRTGCGQSGSVEDQPQYRRLWRCRSSSALSPLSSPSFAHVLTRPKDKSLGRARNARPPGAQPRGRHARRTPYPEAYGRSILGCEG